MYTISMEIKLCGIDLKTAHKPERNRNQIIITILLEYVLESV